MNFSFDVSILQQKNYTGCQIYTHYVLQEMISYSPETTFHLHFMMPGWNPRIDELTVFPNVVVHRSESTWERHLGLAYQIVKNRCRCHYIMNGLTGVLRFPLPCPTMALVHDLRVLQFPEIFGEDAAKQYKDSARQWMRQRNVIVTGAETIKQEIISNFAIASEQVLVAPEATDHLSPNIQPVRPKVMDEGTNYFLMFNLGDPLKNWRYTLKAFDQFCRIYPDDSSFLVLAGSLRSVEKEVKAAIEDNPRTANRILLTGYVSDEELIYLYQNAHALLFPSLYEGFGIPTLEAMGQGTPVLLSDIPIFREVGDKAALYAPLSDPSVMAKIMYQVVKDRKLREQLVHAGRERSEQFSWQHSAIITLKKMEDLARR